VGNALWLFFAVPKWYCSTIVSPFSAGALSAIPALGILSLAIGVVVGLAKREASLLAFLLPSAASQILVVLARSFSTRPQPFSPLDHRDLHAAPDCGRRLHRLAAGRRKVAGGGDSNFHFIICILCGLCRRNGI
jgi:hypothetical protein